VAAVVGLGGGTAINSVAAVLGLFYFFGFYLIF
jgi:hypothetical protein